MCRCNGDDPQPVIGHGLGYVGTVGSIRFGFAGRQHDYCRSGRALLGAAGATLQPSILALISNMFRNDKRRSTAISPWATSLLVGGALGPLVGGVLLQKFWSGSVFLIGVPCRGSCGWCGSVTSAEMSTTCTRTCPSR